MADLQSICLDDTCMNNPICCNGGYFTGTSDVSVAQDSVFDPRAGVSAYDENGDPIPFVAVPAQIDTSVIGEQYVAYIASGADPVIRTVTVVSTQLYASIDTATKEMHFFLDEENKWTDGQEVGTTTYYTGFEERAECTWASPLTWSSKASVPTKVVFDTAVKPLVTCGWFSGFNILTSIENIELLDTSDVTNMSSMFYRCTMLREVDVSGFDTSNVTAMNSMFDGCSNLTSIDVSGFDTSNVTTMSAMFSDCHNLASIDVSGFDTSNVTTMASMFLNCRSLKSIDLCGFDTANVTQMGNMFNGCSLLTTISASSRFVVGQVTSSPSMFTGATRLVGGAGTTYSATYVNKTRAKIDGGADAPGYFTGCEAYAYYDSDEDEMHFFRDDAGKYTDGQVIGTKTYYTGIETSTAEMPTWHYQISPAKVVFDSVIAPVSTSYWFDGFSNQDITIENIELLDTSGVVSMKAMFKEWGGITSPDLSGFDTSNVTNMEHMFGSMYNAETPLDLSSFDTSNVINTTEMFYSCELVPTIYASSSFVVDQVVASMAMFASCHTLVGGAGTYFTINHTDKEYARIDNPPDAPGYFTAKP